MQYIVSLSGGSASAVAAERAINRFGRKNVMLWFADTTWEDEDLYRFVDQCMMRWGGKLYKFRDGRNPLEVASDRSIIPNQKHAPCSQVLKVDGFMTWLWKLPKPVTVLLGLDWMEQHRINDRIHYHRAAGKPRRPVGYGRKIPGVYEDYPLNWKPYERTTYEQVVASWGIEPPRIYAEGFPHNNCGGRCVKQGIDGWVRLYYWKPERFQEVKIWEQEQRTKSIARSKYAILRDFRGGSVKPMTLEQLEQRIVAGEYPKEKLRDNDKADKIACFCNDGAT